MNRKMMMVLMGMVLSAWAFAQNNTGLLIGDFNKVGDFVSLKPQKVFDIDLTKDLPKFTKLKLGEKDLVLSYKVTGTGKGAVRYFDPVKNEWVDVITVECCADRTKGRLQIFDGKAFKYKNDFLFFYSEIAASVDSTRQTAEKKRLQIVKFLVGSSFRKYDINLNPQNHFAHKIIVSKWLIREQFGDIEDKYKEYSVEDKAVTSMY
ncbi:MAG: hypothetical protein NTU44_05590 [Bacteroidetes bacterium]|nr:hypothetical protein [Bacteroidota bacterium]